MTINQLFRNKVPLIILDEIAKDFGLDNINDSTFFSRRDIECLNIVNNINNMGSKLSDYYLPCKKKVYFTNLNSKKCITIFRQCLKLYNYKLKSKEKYIKSEKVILYQIIPSGEILIKTNNKKGCIISFD